MQQAHWQLDRSNRTATHLTDTPLASASFTKSYIAGHAAERSFCCRSDWSHA